jgi:hypothetical protein
MIDREAELPGSPLARAQTAGRHRRLAALSVLAILVLVLGAIAFVLLQAEVPASAQRAPAPGQRILAGAAFHGRLWLQNSGGVLASYGLSDGSSQVHFDSGVTALVKTDTALWALRHVTGGRPASTPKETSPRQFLVSAWRNEKFEDLPPLDVPQGDTPVALAINGGTPVVLLNGPDPGPSKDRMDRLLWRVHRVLSNDGSGWKATELSGTLPEELASSPRWDGGSLVSLDGGRSLYVGLDFGEFGGGLQRVDLATGASHRIERHDSGEYCFYPLDSRCDAVTGVLADPNGADCVFASVGLVHLFTSTGRILRVCGDAVEVVLEAHFPPDLRPNWIPEQAFSHMTDAFYALVATKTDGFWAATPRTLYHFDHSQRTAHPIPELKPFGRLRVSRDLPGIIVVRSEADHRFCAGCGPAPFLVAAD